ncbi:MAG: ribonuclease Z [Clostridiales bacterium]|nr:ribonuclease Z [Clostridiales bacterium]
MLNVTLLGSGGGMPMPDRFLSSLLIKFASRKILIDCGEGTQVAMRKYKSGFKSLDIICLTHDHGDHIFGLPGLLSTIGNSGRTDPITIMGPVGIKRIIEGMMVAIPFLPFDLDIVECTGSSFSIHMVSQKLRVKKTYLETNDNKVNDNNYYNIADNNISTNDTDNTSLVLSILELDHSSPCLGYSFYLPRRPKFNPEKALEAKIPVKYWSRLQKGQVVMDNKRTYHPSMVRGKERKGIKLSYIVDTRPTADIPDFIHESDLFICEGTYGDSDDMKKAIKNKHMTFAESAQLASLGKTKELWLTHFSPAMDKPEQYMDNARQIFVKTVLGYDGLSKSLQFPES